MVSSTVNSLVQSVQSEGQLHKDNEHTENYFDMKENCLVWAFNPMGHSVT